jgi:acyl-[acyl-carrier-protein]-phospholipid O-acyltransferase/long-chain-fatty-acid--[acyl-carrier-protein] ligase
MEEETKKSDHAFAWLNATQFLGALNDNIFKLLVILFLIGAQTSAAVANVPVAAHVLLVVPFLLFLAFAGRLADRHSKRNIIVSCKAAELVVMLMAVAAFWIGSPLLLYCVFFCMAAQSTFFSPCKYGIIRELVTDEKVSKANGWIEAATFVAIIIGTTSAPLFPKAAHGNYTVASLICLFVATAGLATSTRITKTPPAGGTNKASVLFFRDIWHTVWSIQRKRPLLWAVIGSAYFWLVGAVVYIAVIPYAIEYLSLTKEFSVYLYMPAAFGIVLGSLLAGQIWAVGLIPIGAVGMGACCLALGLIGPSLLWVCVLIFLMGFSAGLYIVPVHTLVQLKSPKYRRSEIIAASSFLTWLAMLASAGVVWICTNIFKFTTPELFVLIGDIALIVAVLITTYLIEFVPRLISAVLVRFIYRPKVVGAGNVPTDGGALLICNHVSYADAPLIDAACPRPVRFVMDRNFYDIPWLKPICKLGRTIPILAKDPPKKIAASIRQARNAIKAGDVVCVFAEGYMTRNGNMLSFKAGFQRIVRGTKAPIIPAYIGGMWGSILSYYHGRPFATLPKKFANPVSVHFDQALPNSASAEQVKLQVQQLSCDHFNTLKSPKRSLVYRFIRTTRKNRRRPCISDASGKKLNYSQTLTAALALANKIKALPAGNDRIGILLPPSVGAALANIAVTFLGKVPVNLNYTSALQPVNSAITECDIKCVISSKEFLERFPELKTVPNLVFLEDLHETIDSGDKFKAVLKSRLCPARFLAAIKRHSCDDVATIIFSSGSGGRPKGVMLSHHNIISNIESTCSIFKLKPNDNLCAVLPFFHSFGFTCSLWLPIINGVSAAFVPNPLDGKAVGRTARLNRSTVLFAAPTFINNYLKRIEAADLSNLRFVMAGAEELKTNIADAFEQKFGIRPREGYGATELSPVVAFNVADIEVDGLTQTGTKDGTVGHSIPGIAARVADPETEEILADGREGLLMIKGPTVMLGYLNNEEKTREVIEDGWYRTGDIATIDSDGFIKITGRLARFSKIGGEMVPHVAIENVYHSVFDSDQRVVAVTAVPDQQKGEELVVLYLAGACQADQLHQIISQSNLPNLYKPKRENYFAIDKIPTLGSGKLDLMQIKKIAAALKNED